MINSILRFNYLLIQILFLSISLDYRKPNRREELYKRTHLRDFLLLSMLYIFLKRFHCTDKKITHNAASSKQNTTQQVKQTDYYNKTPKIEKYFRVEGQHMKKWWY